MCWFAWPAALGEERPAPEVYTVIPPQPVEKKPGQLEKWQLEQYFDKGFLVLPNFFSREELQPAIEVREYDLNTQLPLLMCLYSFGLLLRYVRLYVEQFHAEYYASHY